MTAGAESKTVTRVMAATDRSETANRAVRWAANLAADEGAELLLLQVIGPPADEADSLGSVETAWDDLQRVAEEMAGKRGRARVVAADDPALAIVAAAAEERADVLVVGNVGMSGRKRFLLGNVPNRVSHMARCTVVIVNTAEQDGDDDAPGTGEPPPDGEETVLFARAMRIGRVMARAGMREILSRPRLDDPESLRQAASRLRDALDELGPTFAKLGQILSTRPDLLPPAFIDALASLQERVTPLTEEEVVSLMEAELGVPWEDVFASIEPVPLAAGTIAQVHRATLETGERVVVKIQRPHAQEEILQDLGLLQRFAEKAASRPALRRVFDMQAMIEHLSSSLRRELDFRGEAANIERMRETLEPFSRLAVPRVYKEYSTARLLVMEEVEGIPIWDAPDGPARREAARQLLESYYHQVMTAGFFHADPHPGNLKWWHDRIYFLDLGMVGELDAGVRELVLMVLLAFAQRDGAFLAEVVLMLAAGGSDRGVTDYEGFRADLQALIDKYRDLSLKDMQLGPIFQEVTGIALRHSVRLPASLMLTGKAFAQMQLAATGLDSSLDPFEVAQSFVLRKMLRRLTHGLDPQQLIYDVEKARLRVNRMIEGLEGALGARPGRHLQVDFRGTDRLEATIERESRRLSLALGLGGALFATTLAAGSQRVPRWVPAVMSGIGGAIATRLLLDREKPDAT